MNSCVTNIIAIVLLLVSCNVVQGQTVLFDFQTAVDDFLHFGNITTDSGLINDCDTVGNVCASHTANFTENATSPNDFGIGELGPFFFPTTIDLSGFVGYSIDARFIRDIDPLDPNNEVFTGISPIKFGLQWDPTDPCGTSMNACSDLYDEPVMLTEEFQTFTVMFDDFLMGNPRNAAQIKMLMLTGEVDPNSAPTKKFVSGDFDASNSVDGLDFLKWQTNVGLTHPSGGAPRFSDGNANLDVVVGSADLDIWEGQYATDAPIADWSDGLGRLEFDNIIGILPPPLASASTVPEPASGVLLLGSSLLLFSRIRPKQN